MDSRGLLLGEGKGGEGREGEWRVRETRKGKGRLRNGMEEGVGVEGGHGRTLVENPACYI